MFVIVIKGSINAPLHRELKDCVELPKESSRSLPDLNVIAVCEAGGGGW